MSKSIQARAATATQITTGTKQNIQSPARRCLPQLHRLSKVLLLLPSLIPASAQVFSAAPSQLALTTSYTVTISQANCQEPGGDLNGATASTGTSGLTLTPLTATSALTCQAAWKTDVAATAPLGKTNLIVVNKAGKSSLVTIEVIGSAPGATPPGLDHQVDVMWDILPYKAVADSFGRKVANQYFAIRVMLGNNSGYPIQISAIGFQTPAMKSAKIPPVPNDPYFITRGTIEREQQIGRRAIVLGSINAIAAIMTGASGFVRAKDAANFNLAVSLANPVTAGFNLVWPDTTIRHLLSMDTRSFRDAAIVPNNVPSPPIVTFISRRLVECGGSKSTCGAPFHGITRVSDNKAGFNPNEIADALGEMVIEGQPIYYLPRVQITGNSVAPSAAPPAASGQPILNPLATPLTYTAGSKPTVTLFGTNLKGATVTSTATSSSGGAISNVAVNTDGTMVTFTIDLTGVTANNYTFTVDNKTAPPATLPFTVQ